MSQYFNVNLKYLLVHMLVYNKHLKYTLFISVPCVTECIFRNDVTIRHMYVYTGGIDNFDVRKSVHHHTIQINQPTRCNTSTSSLRDAYV